MKKDRHVKILELIEKYEIETQDELIDYLNKSGYNVTQATVSRDIRDLKLTKISTHKGTYRYVLPSKSHDRHIDIKFNPVFVESIVRVSVAQNIIVLKTYTGMAQPVAIGIDKLNVPQILGCVAGDDTVIVVMEDFESATDIADRIKELIKNL